MAYIAETLTNELALSISMLSKWEESQSIISLTKFFNLFD